ncbi:NAD(P)-dependent oxidoreductase [Aminobacter sp. MSH1]|uniref:NAD(P)-dependent oxidoreductase n=1 Tax=Aminobacter sp. MSH1 TaxID=374606 RepID=UPI000D38A989|nr:NAD(P)-dependent oxidoreductase [Aminobacter sp. MSH1]
MSDGDTPRIGWIGVGKMGGPMTARLVAAGYVVYGFDPDATSLSVAAGSGVRTAGSLRELVEKADIVFSMIPNDRVLRSVVFGEGGLQPVLSSHQTFVEMSTVAPGVSAEVAAGIGSCPYLRAPVSGSTETATSGSLTVMISGPRTAFEACLPVLSVLSSRQHYLGSGEEARYAKLVLNSMVGASAGLLAEAIALGRSGCLEIGALMELICNSVVASPLLRYKHDSVVNDDYAPAFTVAQMIKDMRLILEAAAESNIAMPTAEIALAKLDRAAQAGLSEQDFFAIVRTPASAPAKAS